MRVNPAGQNVIVVQRLEDLTPFIDGVGPDLISDLMTRIESGVLIDFTRDMMATYPQLARRVSTRDGQVGHRFLELGGDVDPEELIDKAPFRCVTRSHSPRNTSTAAKH
jgi:hypothetical protein